MSYLKGRFLILIGLVFSIAACQDDPEAQDTKAPVVTLLSPQQGDTFYAGDEIHFEAILEDETGLATYHLSVHEGGDGHSHGRIAASSFYIDQSFTVSGKRVEVHEHISIPSDATPGMYHFIVKAIDELGNSTSFTDGSTRELEIEILASSLE